MEEEGSGLHFEYFEAELVVVDYDTVGCHGYWFGRHRIVVDSFVVGLESDVIVFEQGSEVKVVFLLLNRLTLGVILLNLLLKLYHRLLVQPVFDLDLKSEQIHHLSDGCSEVEQRLR